jgi:EAL domain-containing protein (putative c-di-GMP-specific phosphodiesterase class I)/CheY-like chemotaxis protein
MCRAVLSREGWEVEMATNGREGVDAVRAAHGNLDCVVCDVNMPELDGHAFLGEVSSLDEDLPVLLMTADPRLDGAVRAMEAGAISYLSKLFSPEHLAQVVARAARRHGLARMRRRAAVFAETTPDVPHVEEQFERALARSWMAYQPVVDARTGVVRAYEALLRTDETAMQRPDVFIGVAERLDRVPELGRMVRRLVAGDLEQAPDDARVFVNLHPLELADEQLFGTGNPLRAHASRIVIELTERVALDSLVDTPRRVAMLRQAGFAIAIDDLGAGYASIGSLAAIEPEVVKIDMGLVRGIHTNARKHRIVTATATLCRELGSEVVAEGVETVEERRALEQHVDLLQGYLFARPARGFTRLG